MTLAMLAGQTGQALALDDLDEAPDFALKSVAGPNLRLSEYRSEVVVLAFWASWCGECRTQLQGYRDAYESYRSVGFELFGVSLDPEISRARESAESLGLEFPVLHDGDGRVAKLYSVDDLPLVVFIDREGRIRGISEGFSRSGQEDDVSRIRMLLRE